MSITFIKEGKYFNTKSEKNCIAITDSDSEGNFKGINNKWEEINFNVNDIENVIIKTLDGYLIEHEMKVWDYDVERVIVDLSILEAPDPLGQYWFYVMTMSGHRKLMSDTRVWLYHPHTRERA